MRSQAPDPGTDKADHKASDLGEGKELEDRSPDPLEKYMDWDSEGYYRKDSRR